MASAGIVRRGSTSPVAVDGMPSSYVLTAAARRTSTRSLWPARRSRFCAPVRGRVGKASPRFTFTRAPHAFAAGSFHTETMRQLRDRISRNDAWSADWTGGVHASTTACPVGRSPLVPLVFLGHLVLRISCEQLRYSRHYDTQPRSRTVFCLLLRSARAPEFFGNIRHQTFHHSQSSTELLYRELH